MQGCVLSIVPRGYLPELAGGLEICAMETIEFFIEQGYSGAVAAKCPQTFRGKLAARLSRKFKGPFSTIHTVKRHQVYTDYWHPNALGSLFDKLKPDFVVCHVSMCDDLLQKLIALNYPTLFYIHSREISPLFGTLPADHKFAFACESTFIKKQFQQISEAHIDVIRPILPPQKFQVSDTGDAILVINPHPKKGGKLIVEAARQLPHRRFLIVGGWANTLHDPEVVEIEQALTQLPNVTRQAHVEDMRTVFKQAHCLLMPCVVAEAYGRTAANYPTLFYIHSREISPLFGTLPADHKFAFACESTFIKKQFQQISEAHIDVIRPILPPQKFQVSDTGDAILVINPHPKKGGKLIVEAARQLPHRRFLIVGGWANTLHDPEVVEIEQALTQLPNVTRQAHVEDMRTVFKQAHCLLMPCVVAEAYGRTAAEALIAGIPVVASNQGALPETVGDGGIIIDIEAPVTEWTTHLENLFNNSDLYRNLKQQALATSQQDVRQATFIQQQLLDHAKRLSGK